jgi:hypothetical protein
MSDQMQELRVDYGFAAIDPSCWSSDRMDPAYVL